MITFINRNYNYVSMRETFIIPRAQSVVFWVTIAHMGSVYARHIVLLW